MEARELRIGNWVKYSDSDIWIPEVQNMPIQVDIDILVDDEAASRPIEGKYNPIELTPEILEKCGFEVIDSDFGSRYFDVLGFKFWRINNDEMGIPYDPVFWKEDNTNCKLSYLHQLQNLYYALTNTELPITL